MASDVSDEDTHGPRKAKKPRVGTSSEDILATTASSLWGALPSNDPFSMTCMSEMGMFLIQDDPLDSVSNMQEETSPHIDVSTSSAMSDMFIPDFSAPPESTFTFSNRRFRPTLNPGRDPFAVLSDEMLLQIFNYLKKPTLCICACVCRRWAHVVNDEHLWQRMDLSGLKLPPSAVGYILKRGPLVLRMARTQVTPLALEFGRSFRCTEYKVQYLDLSMAIIQPDCLGNVLTCCPNVLKLSLENLCLNQLCWQAVSKLKNLDTLNCTMVTGISATAIRMVTKGCKRLMYLNVSWTHPDKECVFELCRSLPPTMKRLNIAGVSLNDNNLAVLVLTCPALLELDVSDNTGLSHKVLSIIIAGLKNIETLSFSRCYNINPSLYPSLMECQHLVALNVFGVIEETALKILVEGMPKIVINQGYLSTIARPTVGIRRSSIWGQRTRDY